MKKYILYVFSIFLFIQVQAQYTPAVWYFGSTAGIKFDAAGNTTSYGGGNLVNTFEGSTNVNDVYGNVVFYADGKNLWDGTNHHITNLLGGLSATQASLAVQIPGVDNSTGSPVYKYLLFSLKGVEEGGVPNFSVCYIRVTATGIPPAITYSVTADAPAYIGSVRMSEKLAATSDGANGSWVFTHEYQTSGTANKFYGYHIDQSYFGITSSAGAVTMLNTNPLIQGTGGNHSGVGENAQGQMKFNKQGTRLGLVMAGSKKFEIFDFTKSTGALSTSTVFERAVNGQGTLYGCEFSPGGNKFYTSEGQRTSTPATRHIYQWDISGSSLGGPINVATNSNNTSDDYMYDAMQLGPNDKIYCTFEEGTTKLSVINLPDLDACDYNEGVVPVGGGRAYIGLPSYSTLVTDFTPPSSGGCTCSVPSVAGKITNIDKVKGTATVTLTLNPGEIAPAKIAIEFANFDVYTSSDDCKKYCNMTTENMGMIVNPTPMINNVQGELTSLIPNTGMTFSREIIWDLSHTPIWAAHVEIELNLKFPPVADLPCCPATYSAVFRVAYVSKDCQICQSIMRTDGSADKGIGVISSEKNLKVTSEPIQAVEKSSDVTEHPGATGVTVYPNPNDGTFTISATGLGNNLSYTVLDGKGTRVVSGIMKGEKEKVTVPSLRPGMYFVRISNGEKEYVQKVIVQNTH